MIMKNIVKSVKRNIGLKICLKVTILVGLVVFFGPVSASAATYNIFFAGGQSNATQSWVTGIEETLQASNQYENVIVIYEMHGSSPLSTWYDNGPQVNYNSDFFNHDGSPALGQLESMLASAPVDDEYVFSGLFWFQGEHDAFSATDALLYEERCSQMLQQLSQDVSGNSEVNFKNFFSAH